MTDIRGEKYKTIPFADDMIIYLQKSTIRKKNIEDNTKNHDLVRKKTKK